MPDDQTAAAALHALFADAWDFRLQEDPLFATLTGDHRFDDRLPGASPTDWQRRLARSHAFRERLRALERAGLTPADQLNYDIFARVLDNTIAELEFRSYLLPMAKVGGFHTAFLDMLDYVPLATTAEYARFIARLDAFEGYVHEHIALMRTGIRDGYLPARVTLDGVDAAIRAQLVDDPAQHTLFKPFAAFPRTVPAADQPRLAAAGRAAIARSVVPGYAALLRFLVDEYLPAAREESAVSALPNGRAFYEHRVRASTTLDITPEEIHATGLRETGRIRGEMEEIIRATGFTGDFADFVDFLRTDPRFYVATPEALMKEVAFVLKKMDGELPRLFGRLPRIPYGIKEVPAYSAPQTTTAYYCPPPGDGSRAGIYYVNTYDLRSRPLYEVEALSLHEAVPGHHLQIALQLELDDVPAFRRFEYFAAYSEGWALYTERLGLETGFYQDPYSDFGRLTYEMWRACRLVVDPGMHALGWSRQQAIDFMAENTALTLLNITNEIDRYIAWPGQAVGYKMGELTIRALRAEAEQALGASFDLRGFHDCILSQGAVPLDVLGQQVRNWIARIRSMDHRTATMS